MALARALLICLKTNRLRSLSPTPTSFRKVIPMIPLIGILLCIYLVFKGFEIFQIAYVVKDAPRMSIILGVIAIIASIGIAAVFAFMFLMSDPSVRSLVQ